MTGELRLLDASVVAIRRAAAASPDHEVCGLLIESGCLVEAHLTPNVHPNPARGFAICDKAHAKAQRIARVRDAKIVGCFHSHPSGETAPSETDLLAATEDGFVWLICAPDGRMQAWVAHIRSRSKFFAPVSLELAHCAPGPGALSSALPPAPIV